MFWSIILKLLPKSNSSRRDKSGISRKFLAKVQVIYRRKTNQDRCHPVGSFLTGNFLCYRMSCINHITFWSLLIFHCVHASYIAKHTFFLIKVYLYYLLYSDNIRYCLLLILYNNDKKHFEKNIDRKVPIFSNGNHFNRHLNGI